MVFALNAVSSVCLRRSQSTGSLSIFPLSDTDLPVYCFVQNSLASQVFFCFLAAEHVVEKAPPVLSSLSFQYQIVILCVRRWAARAPDPSCWLLRSWFRCKRGQRENVAVVRRALPDVLPQSGFADSTSGHVHGAGFDDTDVTANCTRSRR